MKSTKSLRSRKTAKPAPRFDSPLGCQLWVEPGDTPARIDGLVQLAKQAGLGQLRMLVLWVRIEREPGKFDFSLYDAAFAAAARHGLRIKATLTANSGPWHIGTPGVLHSHTGFLAEDQREPMRRYIAEVVTRYRSHPGLCQWLLWNEPHGGFKDHVPDNLPGWRAYLRKAYGDNLAALNRRWLTGYESFDEVPWPESVPHSAHQAGAWVPYRAELDEMNWRAERLTDQLRWIAREVRRHDRRTELCYNPIFNIENQAAGATDLRSLSRVVDRMGASYHPVFWHSQVRREDYPGMIAAGVRALAAQSPGKPIELTEVVSGNCITTGSRVGAISAPEITRFYLGALAAGADTVTGWCLNARHRDSETGEFALLDDDDRPSERSRALGRLRTVLRDAVRVTGEWSAARTDVHLALDRRSQAIELIDARGSFAQPPRYGHGAMDSARGQWLIAQRAMEQGLVATNLSFADLPAKPRRGGELLIVSQVVAWEKQESDRVFAFARAGGTVVFDALSGRKDFDSRQHRPWPGFWTADAGLRAAEIEAFQDDPALSWLGRPAGHGVLARSRVETDPGAGWRSWAELRFTKDGEPAVLERPYGRGRLVYLRFPWAPSLLARPDEDLVTRLLLARLAAPVAPPLAPVSPVRGAVVMPVSCKKGELFVVLAPEQAERGKSALRFSASDGRWRDLWTGQALACENGELVVEAPDGVAMLWRP